VSSALGDRRLVFAGIRGGDAEPLAVLPQLSHVVSLTDTFTEQAGVMAGSVEDLTKHRVDLDGDFEVGAGARAWFVSALELATAAQSALVPYRPSEGTSLAIVRSGGACNYLGLHARQQSYFEHKPTVDDAVNAMGIPTLDWEPVRRIDVDAVSRMLDKGPAVARLPFSSGGAGLARVETIEDYAMFCSRTGADRSVLATREVASRIGTGAAIQSSLRSASASSMECLLARASVSVTTAPRTAVGRAQFALFVLT